MKNNPKVLYISHTSELHGSGKALLNIIQSLSTKGVIIYIVLPNTNGLLYNEIRNRKIIFFVHKVTPWIWPQLKTIKDILLFFFRLIRLAINSFIFYFQLLNTVKKIKPDIIHTNVGIIHMGHYLSKQMHIPHVWHIREYQDLFFGWHPFPGVKWFMHQLYNNNNFPIAITQGIYDHYKLINSLNAQVIYDGVFKTVEIPQIDYSKDNYFLYVGLLSEEKGVKEIIQTFIRLNIVNYNIELWIAGIGNTVFIETLKKIITGHEIESKIKFLGYRNDIYSLMSKATALIVPSKFEGFGFITAEAMFNGCLVIGKNIAGTKEQFDNGLKFCGEEIGLRYYTGEDLYNILDRFCNEGLKNQLTMINNAQQTAIELYSIDKNAENIYNLYKKIL